MRHLIPESMKTSFFVLPLIGILLSACQTTKQPDRFDQADRNGDGKLSLDEITEYMVTTIFDTRDANKDKRMTTEEWYPEGGTPAPKEFKARDQDGDGVVSLEEAIAYSKKVGTYKDAMREADTNKDGWVSRAEAIAYYDSKEGPIR